MKPRSKFSHCADVLKNILKTPFLRNILFATLLITAVLTLYSVSLVYPSFNKLLIQSAEEDAKRVATHLADLILPEYAELRKDALPPDVVKQIEKVKTELVKESLSDELIDKIHMLKKDLQLEKLKIYSKAGEVIYSSDPQDLGRIIKKRFFHEIVAKGNVYTKFAHKGTEPHENWEVSSDVVETYVPVMTGESFAGAFEIYYNVSARKEKLDNLLFRSSTVLFAVSMGLLLAVTFILFKASHSIIERRQAEKALKRSEGELRRLSHKLLDAQEEERKRIAFDVHEGVAQHLSSIKFRVEGALKEMDKETPARGSELLGPIVPMVQDTVEEIRKIERDLRPSVLDNLGILATISWFCREFEAAHPEIHIEKDLQLEEDRVPDSLKIIIYRILQESLNNVAKHGQATTVRLFLRGRTGRIELAINDNGTGFDLPDTFSEGESNTGLGLASMKERTELSGGSFSINSQKGEGTTIRASWPS